MLDFGGTGPRVVLVHGLGGSHVNWRALGPRLAEHANVTALDLAGFGRTPLGERSASVWANRRLLDRFLDEVTGWPVVLVGNSMGGMISLLQADRAPEKVAGLVLINPTLPRRRLETVDPVVFRNFAAYALPGVGERFLRRRRERLGVEGLVRETLRVCCVDPARVPPDLYAASLALAYERAAEMPWADRAFLQAARSLLALLANGDRYRRIITSVRCPALLLHGERDRLVPVSAARRVAELRPDWAIEIFDGTGHVPQIECPDRTAEAITRWFLSSDGGRLAVEAASDDYALAAVPPVKGASRSRADGRDNRSSADR